MRVKIILLSFVLFILTLSFVVSNEGHFLLSGAINLNEVEIVDLEFINNEKINKNPSKTKLINVDDFFSAYDITRDVFYIPNIDARISYTLGTNLSIHYSEEENLYTLIATKNNEYSTAKFIETKLPIMEINTKIREEEGKDTRAFVEVYDTNNDYSEYMLDYKQRGGSSRAYEKKSYSLKSIKNLPISILGLPQNNKYVLNSLYEDEYKVRDVLSWDICNQFQSELDKIESNNCFDMLYIEVFMDNQYLGLYGIQEYINHYSLGFGDSYGNIYETRNWIFPGTINNNPKSKHWDSLELKFNNLGYSRRWDSMIEFIELLNIEDSKTFTEKADQLINIDAFINHYLLIETLSAIDNTWKNTFYSKKLDEKILITPWDLDMTFGSTWTGVAPYLTETVYESNPVHIPLKSNSNYTFHKLLRDHENFAKNSAIKYFSYRETFLTKNNLIYTAEKYHNLLRDTGAFVRDNERWPNGPKIPPGYEDFISNFIDRRVDVLDEHFGKILGVDIID